MRIKEGLEAQYQRYVQINASDEYSKEVVDYGERWANLMEADPLLQSPDPEVFARLANTTSHTANTGGITGAMYGAAASALAEFWQYGERLRRWHNSKYGVSEEQAQGRIVDPAVITITTGSDA